MAQVLKVDSEANALVHDDQWQLVADDVDQLPSGDILVPLTVWQQNADWLANHSGAVGVWVNGDEEIEAVADALTSLPLIAINFPKFVDGRGFSVARLLRDRYGYDGELRAIGHIIRDQLFLLKRCGFDAFQFDGSVDLNEAANSLQDFSDAYQVAVDQPVPLFKRR